MSDTTLVGQNLSDTDLSGRDLTGKVLFLTDLRGAQLYNAAITINCDTFDSVILSDEQVALLLKLIALADITPAWHAGIDALVAAVTSPLKVEAINRYLKLHC